MNDNDHLELLNEYIADLQKMLIHFERSREKVNGIKIKDEYTEEEYEALEAFTARFSRLADFVSSKLLRAILILLRDDRHAFIDRANFLEKLEIIPSADLLIQIRDMRNSIVHDYWIEEVKRNFIEVRALAQPLAQITHQAISFCKVRGWVKED